MRKREATDTLLYVEDFDAGYVRRVEIFRDRRGVVFAELTAKVGKATHRWCDEVPQWNGSEISS